MIEVFGVLISVVVALLLALPVLTFLRAIRTSHEIAELKARVSELERAAATTAARATAPVGETWPRNSAVDATQHVPAPQGAAPYTAPPPFPASVDTGASDPREEPLPASASDAPLPAAATGEVEDLEDRIGGRALLYTGVVVFLLGVSFFLKYAFDNEWITEGTRIALGALAGVGLVGAGMRTSSGGLRLFGQALSGAGFAILFLAIYAGFNSYALYGPTAAFALMVVVTFGAAALAHREAAQSLAVIAVLGGFLTPLLVGGDDNQQALLFSYVALLIGGTLLLARGHQWLGLNVLSYLGTLLIVGSWTVRFYTNGQWLRTLLFLTLFCVLFLIILREMRHSRDRLALTVRLLLATAPLFYHWAAVVLTARHPPAIHVYLIAFTAAGLWLTAEPHRPLVRLLVLLAGMIPLFGALTLPDGRSWLVPNVVTIVAVAGLHVMALIDRVGRQEARLRTFDLISLHVAGLGLFALLYETLLAPFPAWRGTLAAMVALGATVLWRWLRQRDEVASWHAAGLALTLLAIGVAVQFDGPPVVVGWAAEGAAAVWLASKISSRGFQLSGVGLWLLAVWQLLEMFSSTPLNFTAIANARTLATAFVLTVGYAMTVWVGRSSTVDKERLRAALHVVASVLTLAWITAEIRSFWEVRQEQTQAFLYEQMMLSLAWGVYGAALIAVGMWRHYAPLRYIGITIIAVTSLKVFFYDLWELGGIYRVIGFLGFGALLVLVSYLYQQRKRVAPPPPPPAITPTSDASA